RDTFRAAAPQLFLQTAVPALAVRPRTRVPGRLLADRERAHRSCLEEARLRREKRDASPMLPPLRRKLFRDRVATLERCDRSAGHDPGLARVQIGDRRL